MNVLAVDGLSVRFGGVQALHDVNVEVAQDEIVGLLGPNGAGKTTFFDCVSGFVRPDWGRIELFGEDVTHLPPEQRARRGLGRTFQQVGLVRSQSVLENLVTAQHADARYGLVAGLLGTPGVRAQERALRERAMVVLEVMGLTAVADRAVVDLPYGLQKMVEVAAVIATNPRLVVLDEPLAGTGPEEGEAFCQRLLDMRRDLGLAIVMIEHHVPLVLKTADYVYVLNFGELLAEGTPDVVRADPNVAEAYMGASAHA